MDLQKSFRMALAERDMTKADLARSLGCTRSYVGAIAKGGTMSVRKLQDVCDVLGYKVHEFVKLGES